MREHEVPTHVQAEDRVLLWFTFPQIVAVTAVCALSYGAYRYVPGPTELRIALAALFALTGIVMIVGKVGGRRLPLVAADLLRYRLGARLHTGTVSQLVRGEPPATAQATEAGPGPLRLVARRARRGLRGVRLVAHRARRRLRRKKRRVEAERQNGRRPFGPLGWLGRRGRGAPEMDKINGDEVRKSQRGKRPRGLLAIAAAVLVAAVAVAPQAALADKYWEDEIGFELAEPVEGRRVFVEALSISGDRAQITLRAATDIDLRVRAFGGPQGGSPRFWGSASLDQGERIDYSLPLDGPMPSFTFSWVDSPVSGTGQALGQAGAVTITHEKIPYPLPEVEGELCDLRLVTLGWTPRTVSGAVESKCVSHVEHPVELQTVAGHASVTETALMDADVTAITGTVSVTSGESEASVAFVPNGLTRFRLGVGSGEAVHSVTIEADLEASLRIAIPPLVRLTHHPERVEKRTETVSLYRPGTSESVSETVEVANPDGTTRWYTISATLSVPGEWIDRDVTLTIVHPERVEAEVVEREPVGRTRRESLAMESRVGSDAPFRLLFLPEPEPAEQLGEQEPAGSPQGWEPPK